MGSSVRVNLQPAFVLHHRPYRDTSAIVDLFTPEYGRLAVVARGMRSKKSRLQGLVQVFQPLLISWSGRGELGCLNNIEAQGRPYMLTGASLISGLYLNELLIRLLHRHEAHIELFNAYNNVLNTLYTLPSDDSTNRQLQCVLRYFELNLLRSLGYAMLLDCDADSGDAVDPAATYHYQLERGPVGIASHPPEQGALLLSGKTLLCLAQNALDPHLHDEQIFKQAKRLMRVVLDHYLGSRPILSRQLFSGYTQLPSASRTSSKETCNE